ncbi:VanZ family protein [Cellulomonas oligotrophica]|uniref:Glycopeptide antibiotics resistance protein n=1 Tax=Cellulomonas oligotrophica TaxID=931536 RepID=A0A7Y9JYV5_9CELL|nr:VanZ family protein [Cellulomonas oligotrophica]NYD87306.1 glycopeptide antibiotics resistance protein [Cellulomonas oligotrophica]GIG34224.1 hypothetical protein Col01nite_33830 [Cellulomonas oligotrophica]
MAERPVRRAPVRAVRVLLVIYLAAVAAVTLGPAPADAGTLSRVERLVAWLTAHGLPVTYLGVEAVANVVMFVPFGVLVSLALPARARGGDRVVVPLALVTSAAIETVQRWLPTRVPTVQDVVLNTVGAALGLLALRVVLAVRRRRAGDGAGVAARATGDDPRRQAPSASRIGPSVK